MAKVLVVDDEPAILGFLKHLFEESGYEAYDAPDGIQGLREFFTAQPDVAVVDMMMPNMDGLELCKRICEVSYVPVIILTALEQIDDKVQAFSAGADDYVTKPVSGRELLASWRASKRPCAAPSGRPPRIYPPPTLIPFCGWTFSAVKSTWMESART